MKMTQNSQVTLKKKLENFHSLPNFKTHYKDKQIQYMIIEERIDRPIEKKEGFQKQIHTYTAFKEMLKQITGEKNILLTNDAGKTGYSN